MEKKNLFHYSITAINTIIAVCALYLAFSHNKQLTDIDFYGKQMLHFICPSNLQKKQALFIILNP